MSTPPVIQAAPAQGRPRQYRRHQIGQFRSLSTCGTLFAVWGWLALASWLIASAVFFYFAIITKGVTVLALGIPYAAGTISSLFVALVSFAAAQAIALLLSLERRS